MSILRCVFLFVFFLLLLLHASLGCRNPQCRSSTRAMSLQDRFDSMTYAHFAPSRRYFTPVEARKLATFVQTMASLLKETVTEFANQPLQEFKTALANARTHDGSKPDNINTNSVFTNLSKINKEFQDVSHFFIPNTSLFKGLKTADGLAQLLALLGSTASTTKGVVARTILAKIAKKFLENKEASVSNSSRRNTRITRRTGRGYLDSEAIILFILGLGIGSVMGLGSVLIPMGLYGGYGAATVPINTQVTAGRRKRRDLTNHTNPNFSALEESFRRIRQHLTKATERYSTVNSTT